MLQCVVGRVVRDVSNDTNASAFKVKRLLALKGAGVISQPPHKVSESVTIIIFIIITKATLYDIWANVKLHCTQYCRYNAKCSVWYKCPLSDTILSQFYPPPILKTYFPKVHLTN